MKARLYNILSDLNKLKGHDDVMKRCVEKKLNNSFNNYANEVDILCKYLLSRNNFKVLKWVSKRK
jgi:hypothetical protein